MADERPTRRRLLRVGGSIAALGVGGLLGGCQGLLGDDGPTGDVSALRHTPADALLAVDLDVATLRDDRALRTALDGNLDLAGRAGVQVPETTGGVFDAVAARTGLDPRGVERVVGFGARDTTADAATDSLDPFVGAYWGAVAWTDWEHAAVRAALREIWEEVEERTYAGRPVLVVPPAEVGLFDDGRIAVGPTRGVEAAIDAAHGPTAAPTGQLATALGAARSGPFRFGLAPAATTDSGGGFTDPVALLAGKIDYVSGALYRDGDRRGLVAAFETGSGADAEDVHESLDSFLALARSGQFGANYRAVVTPLSTRREGSTVSVVYEAPAAAFATTLATVASTLALGG